MGVWRAVKSPFMGGCPSSEYTLSYSHEFVYNHLCIKPLQVAVVALRKRFKSRLDNSTKSTQWELF